MFSAHLGFSLGPETRGQYFGYRSIWNISNLIETVFTTHLVKLSRSGSRPRDQFRPPEEAKQNEQKFGDI